MTPEEQAIFERGYLAGYSAATENARRKWTKAEVHTLKNWKGTNKALAVKINRSVMAVKMKRFKMQKEGEM